MQIHYSRITFQKQYGYNDFSTFNGIVSDNTTSNNGNNYTAIDDDENSDGNNESENNDDNIDGDNQTTGRRNNHMTRNVNQKTPLKRTKK